MILYLLLATSFWFRPFDMHMLTPNEMLSENIKEKEREKRERDANGHRDGRKDDELDQLKAINGDHRSCDNFNDNREAGWHFE